MKQSGVAIGTLLLILTLLGTIYSIRLLIIVLEKTGMNTYEKIARHFFGRPGQFVTSAFIFIFLAGSMTFYILFIGQILESLHTAKAFPAIFDSDWGRRLMVSIYWVCAMVPMAMQLEINALRYAAAVSAAATTFMLIAALIHLFYTERDRTRELISTNVKAVNPSVSLLISIPTFTFAFCCQCNCFEIYEELKVKTVRNVTKTSSIAMSVCTAVYIGLGATVYATFGDACDANFLTNYGNPIAHWYVAVAALAVTVTMTMTYTLCGLPMRDGAIQLLGYPSAYACPNRVRYAVVTCICVITVIIGLFAPSAQTMFGLLGGITGAALSYVFPAVFILKTGEWTVAKVGWVQVIVTYTMAIMGTLTGLGGAILSVWTP